MSIFDWLIIGHFVGDWLLQNDWMALGKTSGLRSINGLVHYLVYTVTIALVLAIVTYTHIAPTVFLICVSITFISHWIIDGGNLAARWMRFFGQRNQTMVRVVIDQTFHLCILGIITTISSSNHS